MSCTLRTVRSEQRTAEKRLMYFRQLNSISSIDVFTVVLSLQLPHPTLNLSSLPSILLYIPLMLPSIKATLLDKCYTSISADCKTQTVLFLCHSRKFNVYSRSTYSTVCVIVSRLMRKRTIFFDRCYLNWHWPASVFTAARRFIFISQAVVNTVLILGR